ncbi:MAG: S24 family peptidase, partial [Bacteroidota bacterium]
PVLRDVLPDSVPPGLDFAATQFVPILDMPLGAGGGGNADQVRPIDYLALPKSYLQDEVEIDPERAFIMKVLGQSMTSLFHDGDLALGERLYEVDRDGVMAFHYDGGLYLKHLMRRPGGVFRAKSENAMYDPFDIDPHLPFGIIGRIVRRLTQL